VKAEGGVLGERVRGLFVLADDDPRWKLDPVEQARAAIAGGAAVIQLRAKHATDREALCWCAEIRALARAGAALFFVNDRFDLALAAGADGVHLGQEDLPPARLPAEIRRRLLIGRSTHTLEQAYSALDEPVDYMAFGPVFGTRSKQSPYEARGVPLLAEVVQVVAPRPVIAIGGIDAGNAREIAHAGAAGAAVISAVAAADYPERAARELVRALREAATL
jgi:thiamine-phosphate pyrophosphorylase